MKKYQKIETYNLKMKEVEKNFLQNFTTNLKIQQISPFNKIKIVLN